MQAKVSESPVRTSGPRAHDPVRQAHRKPGGPVRPHIGIPLRSRVPPRGASQSGHGSDAGSGRGSKSRDLPFPVRSSPGSDAAAMHGVTGDRPPPVTPVTSCRVVSPDTGEDCVRQQVRLRSRCRWRRHQAAPVLVVCLRAGLMLALREADAQTVVAVSANDPTAAS